ncbi:hypothetical protein [Bacillus cereus]|uniref:hypothetical protein n=1 Tax=Bacillus cereus TaxID=1396 RepID=UPI000994BFDC|nr:hypothetical protein [Bacillus cereus]OPA18189.1 hypothetical protein BHL54_02890 [Bacillus cereus]
MQDSLMESVSLNFDIKDIDYSLINYLGSDIEYNLDVIALDPQKIVFEDKNIEKKICIKWDSILGNTDGYMPNDKGRVRFIPNEQKWFHLFGKYNFEKDNPGLEVYPYKGFYFKNYAEFFINDENLKFNWKDQDIEFSIGSVKVKIGRPTDIFKLLNNYCYQDIQYNNSWYGEWKEFITISFSGIQKDEVENYLQQAIYATLLNNRALSNLSIGFDYRVLGEEEEEGIFINNGKSYNVAKYPDVINFYNEARKPGNLDKALNYYKVLEYFFMINRENEILSAVEKYNNMANKADLISNISKIAKENEETSLKLLIGRISPRITEVIEDAFEKKLIKENSHLAFAEELYSVRNDFVHAKQNHRRFEVWVPSILKEEEKYEWIHILEKIAMECIKEFCFE